MIFLITDREIIIGCVSGGDLCCEKEKMNEIVVVRSKVSWMLKIYIESYLNASTLKIPTKDIVWANSIGYHCPAIKSYEIINTRETPHLKRDSP